MRVLELWRYPVKSLQGERLEEVAVMALGLDGDRSHGILDLTTGLVLTARRSPPLLLATGLRRSDGGVEVVLPDGRVTRSDQDLSAWLGRAVRLERASPSHGATYEYAAGPPQEGGGSSRWEGPAGALHDSGSVRVSLVGRGTISALGNWDVRRFRPNVVVDGGDEDALIGRRVRIGDAILEVLKPVSRCVMVTRPQPGGIERDLDVLRTVLRERGGNLSVGAVVPQPGPVRVGDRIEVLA